MANTDYQRRLDRGHRRDIAVPFVVVDGDLATVSGADADNQVIRVALVDTTSNHAYLQRYGSLIRSVYDINGEHALDKIRNTIVSAFTEFERQKRFRLTASSINVAVEDDTIIVSFRYICLESDAERSFAMRV
jgi:hypothetical protein